MMAEPYSDQELEEIKRRGFTNCANIQRLLATIDSLQEEREELLANPVSWREGTFRLRMEQAEAQVAELQAALREELDEAEWRHEEERDEVREVLREFEHVAGEPLHETAEVAMQAYQFARHRADSQEARVAELQAAIEDALGRRQVTHIHAALRAALAGESSDG